jgi:Flp pilus assembly protein TadD
MKLFSLGMMIAVGLAISGCQTRHGSENSGFGEKSSTLNGAPASNYYASDEPLAQGINQFNAGNYGKAEVAFRKATQLTPTDGTAWLGLAASYDRLRRFDAADGAYREAAKYAGTTAEYYNNVGYSYLLRGNLQEARRFFLKAYELDPSNETTANNLALLRASIRSPDRST